jgi:HAE1 family hydrophobic/amphiphilic exporter-1
MLFMAFLLSAATAPADGTNTVSKYTLGDCIRIGLERSATALNARRDQEIARSTVTQTRAQVLPQLAAEGGYTRLDELQTMDIGGEATRMGTLDNYSVSLRASQLLYSGGKMGAAIAAAKLARVYADWELANAEAALIRDIRTGFYDVLLAKSMVEVKQESVQQIESLVDQTEQKFKNGRASEFDLLSARVRLANEKPELIRARNMLQLAVEGFKRLINVEDAGFDVEGSFEFQEMTDSFDSLCRSSLQGRPALKEIEAGVALREQDLAAAKSPYYPAISSYFTYTGANSYQFVSFGSDLEWRWSAGVTASWSLWDSGLTRSTVRIKRLELDKARTALRDARMGVTLEIKQAYLEMQRARETIEAGRGNVEMAEKALSISKSRLDSGLATYLEFTDANQALREAQFSLSLALRDHMAAAATLRYAAGISEVANQQTGEKK